MLVLFDAAICLNYAWIHSFFDAWARCVMNFTAWYCRLFALIYHSLWLRGTWVILNRSSVVTFTILYSFALVYQFVEVFKLVTLWCLRRERALFGLKLHLDRILVRVISIVITPTLIHIVRLRWGLPRRISVSSLFWSILTVTLHSVIFFNKVCFICNKRNYHIWIRELSYFVKPIL
jgi:hypothetical protein